MTHQHNSNGREWLMVEVPMEAEVKLFMTNLIWKTFDTPHDGHNIILPDGTWQIHSDSTTITEEQAGEIVEKGHKDNHSMWIDYQCADWACMTPTESYRSLLRSLGLEGKRIINLKKINQ